MAGPPNYGLYLQDQDSGPPGPLFPGVTAAVARQVSRLRQLQLTTDLLTQRYPVAKPPTPVINPGPQLSGTEAQQKAIAAILLGQYAPTFNTAGVLDSILAAQVARRTAAGQPIQQALVAAITEREVIAARAAEQRLAEQLAFQAAESARQVAALNVALGGPAVVAGAAAGADVTSPGPSLVDIGLQVAALVAAKKKLPPSTSPSAPAPVPPFGPGGPTFTPALPGPRPQYNQPGTPGYQTPSAPFPDPFFQVKLNDPL